MSEQPPITLREHEPMSRHTSWRIGGPARYYAEAADVAELRAGLAWARAAGLPALVVGAGTNLLVSDAGYPGLVLRYRAAGWRVDDHGDGTATARVEAGAPMAGTVRRLAAMGWGGLEWAEGLPGSLGGAVYGNAGCYGGEMAAVLVRAELLVGDAIEVWPAARLGLGYRTSALKALPPAGRPIVLAAELALRRADPAALAEQMARTAAERKAKTPWGSSCGSVFKNPPGHSAGRLIEAAGLKGARVGGAEISERHANYIVNTGGASSADILGLVALARATVSERFGVELELEVQVVPGPAEGEEGR